MNRSHLQELERGDGSPTLQTIVTLCTVMRLDPSVLLQGIVDFRSSTSSVDDLSDEATICRARRPDADHPTC